MRMINTKVVPVKKSNLKVILDFTKAICSKAICLQVPRLRFEIIETEHTYQFKFYLLKSKISPIENYWLRKRIKKFINEEA